MKNFLCLPFLLPNQNNVSPLYSAKVFDILQRKESCHTHTMLIEFTDLQVLRFDKVNRLLHINFLVRCLVRLNH